MFRSVMPVIILPQRGRAVKPIYIVLSFFYRKKERTKEKMLLNDKGFRRLRTATKGAAFGNRNFLKKIE